MGNGIRAIPRPWRKSIADIQVRERDSTNLVLLMGVHSANGRQGQLNLLT